MKRKGMSKSKRFEIFKRDGFRCLYCGVTPMQAVLRVDHVVPVKDGGDDEPANLVTSCFDCNAGKSATPLTKRKLAVPVGTEEHREHADQILEWLQVQRDVSDAKGQVADALREEWRRRFGDDEPQGLRTRLNKAAAEFGVAKVVEALDIVEERCDSRGALDRLRYLYGVLRRWRSPPAETEAIPEEPCSACIANEPALRRLFWAFRRTLSLMQGGPRRNGPSSQNSYAAAGLLTDLRAQFVFLSLSTTTEFDDEFNKTFRHSSPAEIEGLEETARHFWDLSESFKGGERFADGGGI